MSDPTRNKPVRFVIVLSGPVTVSTRAGLLEAQAGALPVLSNFPPMRQMLERLAENNKKETTL